MRRIGGGLCGIAAAIAGLAVATTPVAGSQVIATVPVHTLLANAAANGDAAAHQGFHFKLDLEDPRTGGSIGDDKYKVFWVSCGVQRSVSTPTPTPSVTPTPTPTA